MRTDVVSVAETLVRDCLETLIQRHEAKLAPKRNDRRTQEEAASVIALASSLLEHLDADAKQMRAEHE